MNSSFPRIIALLRKECGYSQKQVAQDLGISQALLSHYEKGIRECGLDFLTRIADYYGVSCDYLLGRTPDRNGAFLTVEDIPEPDAAGRETIRGSILPTLNKKLIANSLNIVFDKLQRCNNKGLTGEISAFLMLSVYRVLRLLYGANAKNPEGTFAVPSMLARGTATAHMQMAETNAECLSKGMAVGEMEPLLSQDDLAMTPDQLAQDYPLFASSLFNLIQNAEIRMGYNNKK
ncbi:helix-turn-helix domain-containing protein [Solibaculum mannosilyticum]|uniref:HTH cro/C1-type domain-containing protein n=1 Tax=Solibaculum mannosilyticum TaxID=2780922 RepID=A0A7I8D288_9FIRM|nr:helix-turn-helix domain-containing protein [Solibaculum mannosilyticum]MCO7137485.1 helix-turn-helix domain-containing protein [[Clostridium] leptum]BCI60941.1 hypothetical protein C12CBH8_15800 [Solibaculum mannosilyticum]